MAETAFAEIARAALGGDDGLGIRNALLCRGHAVHQRILRALSRVQRRFYRITRGNHGIQHRLFSGHGLAAQLHARDECVQDRDQVLRIQFRLSGKRFACLHERRSVQRAGSPADRGHKRHAGSFEHRADVLALHHRALLFNLGEAARQIDAMVAVADNVVEFREKKFFLRDLLADGV